MCVDGGFWQIWSHIKTVLIILYYVTDFRKINPNHTFSISRITNLKYLKQLLKKLKKRSRDYNKK